MKRRFSMPVVLVTITALLMFNSCVKNVPPEFFFNPLAGGCQVAEFHNSQFDGFFPTKPAYFFRKTFDPSGKIVKEIAGSFAADLVPQSLPQESFDLLIEQKGWVIYLIKNDPVTAHPRDTLIRVYLNKEGRPDSSIGTPGVDPQTGFPQNQYYYYKKNRLFAVKITLALGDAFALNSTDTISYDKYGNPVSFQSNVYHYDYTRRVKQQMYLDDYMGGEADYYLLQYLGFFPEVTSPVNLRIYAKNSDVDEGGDLANHQFDADGRLTGYDFEGVHNTITWNCR